VRKTLAGEAHVGLSMGEVVGDVGKPGAARREVGDDGEGLLDGEVHGVGDVAEGVEDEVVEVAEERTGGVGEMGEVGEIGGAADAEAEDACVAVDEGDGDEVGFGRV